MRPMSNPDSVQRTDERHGLILIGRALFDHNTRIEQRQARQSSTAGNDAGLNSTSLRCCFEFEVPEPSAGSGVLENRSTRA